MKNLYKMALAGVVAIPLAAAAQQADGNTARVLENLHRTNQMEIQMGAIASSKASANDVKNYANHLVTQHRDADQEVMDVAKEEHVKLEAKPVSDKAPDIVRLRKMKDHDFDREFLKQMVDGHDKAISMVKNAEGTTKDEKLRTLLEKLLPSLEEHRNVANRLLSQSAQR